MKEAVWYGRGRGGWCRILNKKCRRKRTDGGAARWREMMDERMRVLNEILVKRGFFYAPCKRKRDGTNREETIFKTNRML